MRTSEQAWSQIAWDPRLDPARFVVGVDVHLPEPERVPLPDFVPGGDIPWHRVLFFELDGAPCWDRRTGLDRLDAVAASGTAAPRVLPPPLWEPRRVHGSASIDAPDVLRLLTWNVLWDRYDAAAIRSDERWPRLIDLALGSGAHVVAFQEATPAFHALLLADPRVRDAWWVSHPPRHADVARAHLLLVGRVPVRELAWCALGPHKAALAAVLDAGPTVVTTHLTSDHAREAPLRRAEELARIRAALAGVQRPCVLLGDLNLADEGPLDGLVDAWTALRDPEPTFDPTGNPLAALSSRTGRPARLDRVLLSGDAAPDHVELVGQEPVDGLHPSDHWGVVADVRFEVGPERFLGPPTPRSALAWLPPDAAWPALQTVREGRDPRGFARWPPHVNVLWGFVAEADLDAATVALTAAILPADPFPTRLGTAGAFDSTHFLAPDDPSPWHALHRRLRRHFPALGDAGYTPHLTLARGAPVDVPAVEGRVDRLAVLTRRGRGAMAVRGWVTLGRGVAWAEEPPWSPGAPPDDATLLDALGRVAPVVPVGSAALGTALDGADLDVLVLQPHPDADALVAALRPAAARIVRAAGLDGIHVRLGDRAVDLVLVPIGTLPADDAVSRRLELPEAAAQALTAVSDAEALLARVRGREEPFRALTRWAKAFARANGLDDPALGGVEGLAWAVLAAEVVERYADDPVRRFVSRWAAWDWRRAVGGPDDPSLAVCVHTPSAPVRPITRRADRARLEGALLRAWDALERGRIPADLLRPPPWHRLHADAVEVLAEDDAALGLARGRALALVRSLGPVEPRRTASGFALGLPRDASADRVDALVAAWAEGMPGVAAQRRPTAELDVFAAR